MRLLVAVPTLDYIHYKFTECLVSLTKKLASDGIDFDVRMQGNTLVYIGRSMLVDTAINGGYTHVLWLDADMVFDCTVFDKLYKTDKSFVTAICLARRSPHKPCLYKSLQPSVRYDSVSEYGTEPFKVGGCGFGCVLTETRILQDVKKRHYYPFFPTTGMSEDIAFCKRASDIGYEIWANPDIRVGHITSEVIYPNDFDYQ